MAVAKLNYELKSFDTPSLGATHIEWRSQMAGNALLLGQYQRIFDWSLANVDYANNKAETFAFGIFEVGGPPHADAIAEVVYTKSGSKWVKMLDLHLSPKLDAAFYSGTVSSSAAAHISAAAVAGLIVLSGSGLPSGTVKLFARHEPLHTFFTTIAEEVNKQLVNSSVEVRMDGRWLVFEK